MKDTVNTGVVPLSEKSRVTILKGPDRFALSIRLFDGSNKEQLPVSFTVADGFGLRHQWEEFIKLNSAEREDGSGLSWNLTGYNVANSCPVRIYYSLVTRIGTMTFQPSEFRNML